MPDGTENKSQWLKNKKLMLVRYGRMNSIGLFEHNESQISKTEAYVVVKTRKGLELGKVIGGLGCYRAGRFRWDGEQLLEYYENSDIELSFDDVGKFVRYATADDISEDLHFKKISKEEITRCQGIADDMHLVMKIVDAEHILGGERIIFYFMAEGRVDFRELVKKLSHEFQTRIEMRQIGARDEARILGDIESCGQECCCRRFLKFLKPVNMRMAKMQKATLDPAKISGYCGRLKCCLRYEDCIYAELKKRLPKRNTTVQLPDGQARVVDSQILTQLVVMEKENGDRLVMSVDEIENAGRQAHTTEPKAADQAAGAEPRPGADKPKPRPNDKPRPNRSGDKADSSNTSKRPRRRRKRKTSRRPRQDQTQRAE